MHINFYCLTDELYNTEKVSTDLNWKTKEGDNEVSDFYSSKKFLFSLCQCDKTPVVCFTYL